LKRLYAGTKPGRSLNVGFFVHPDVSYRAKAPASLEKKLLVSCGDIMMINRRIETDASHAGTMAM